MTRLHGFRNFILGMAYLGVCVLFAHWDREHITQLGPTFISLGAGTTGVVMMRAANKWAENGKGKP